MKKAALVLIFLLVCATLVASAPWNPTGRDERREKLRELILLLKLRAGSDVESRLRDIIVDQLGVDKDEVTLHAGFVDDLGADSLDTVELVMAIEEEFEIEIPDEEAEKMQTVKDVINYINENNY